MPTPNPCPLTMEQAEAICLKYGQEKPVSLTLCNSGSVNDVYLLGNGCALKIFSPRVRDIQRFAREAQVLEIVAKQQPQIPVPPVYGYGGDILEKPYVLMGELKGRTLDTVWDEMSAEQRARIIENLGGLLAKIHSVEFPNYGRQFDGKFLGPKSCTEYLHHQLDQIEPKIKDKDLPMYKMRTFVDTHCNREGNSSLIQGNYKFGHVLVDDEFTITGIIDWEWARAGHPEEDFARFFFRDLAEHKEFQKTFLDAYTRIHPLPEGFEERSKGFMLLYDLHVLPHLDNFEHQPWLAERFVKEVDELFKEI